MAVQIVYTNLMKPMSTLNICKEKIIQFPRTDMN